jgi:hypothetical protein
MEPDLENSFAEFERLVARHDRGKMLLSRISPA